MKLASYVVNGQPSYGLVSERGLIDLGTKFGRRFPTLRTLLAAGELEEVARAGRERKPDYQQDQVTFLPTIPDPEKIFCVGINYHAHREETGRSEMAYPTIFTRYANTQVGHAQPLIKPRVSNDFDYEAELAVIIGKRARHVSKERAFDYIAGYACFNDGSVRDWQRHTSQFTPGKNFVGTAGLGPWMATKDEVSDPTSLSLVMRLNGREMQRTTTDLMIFDIRTLIQYLTTFSELVPGDVIATGTPGGVGSRRNPPVWMKPGDIAEVEISGIGVLRNPVVGEE